MGFGRVETVILICAVILLLLGVGLLLYKLVKITLLRLCFLMRNGDRDSLEANSTEDRRIQNLLARPGIRNILATRSQSLAPKGGASGQPFSDPPPSYDPKDRGPDIETISSYSGPPPSYHSQIGD